MARGAGGLHGSRTRWRRAHGPALALSCTLGTPPARSSAAPLARASAAIFPASRPARALRAPAQFCPSRVGGALYNTLPLVHPAWGRVPRALLRPLLHAQGPAQPFGRVKPTAAGAGQLPRSRSRHFDLSETRVRTRAYFLVQTEAPE